MEIKSSEIDNFNLLRREIKSICNFGFVLNEDLIKSKGWVYAYLDDMQLLDDDADNLVFALRSLGVDCIYGAWMCDLEKNYEVPVDKIAVNVDSIIEMQGYESRIEILDSILFSAFPLRFLIVRPVTYQDLLYLVGPIDFVKKAANSFGWRIVTS